MRVYHIPLNNDMRFCTKGLNTNTLTSDSSKISIIQQLQSNDLETCKQQVKTFSKKVILKKMEFEPFLYVFILSIFSSVRLQESLLSTGHTSFLSDSNYGNENDNENDNENLLSGMSSTSRQDIDVFDKKMNFLGGDTKDFLLSETDNGDITPSKDSTYNIFGSREDIERKKEVLIRSSVSPKVLHDITDSSSKVDDIDLADYKFYEDDSEAIAPSSFNHHINYRDNIHNSKGDINAFSTENTTEALDGDQQWPESELTYNDIGSEDLDTDQINNDNSNKALTNAYSLDYFEQPLLVKSRNPFSQQHIESNKNHEKRLSELRHGNFKKKNVPKGMNSLKSVSSLVKATKSRLGRAEARQNINRKIDDESKRLVRPDGANRTRQDTKMNHSKTEDGLDKTVKSVGEDHNMDQKRKNDSNQKLNKLDGSNKMFNNNDSTYNIDRNDSQKVPNKTFENIDSAQSNKNDSEKWLNKPDDDIDNILEVDANRLNDMKNETDINQESKNVDKYDSIESKLLQTTNNNNNTHSSNVHSMSDSENLELKNEMITQIINNSFKPEDANGFHFVNATDIIKDD